eukprot:GEMP01031842.1.p1 GENE.GEMP01031842.1~~GEMP01031842.1.p1  ORF type:complete len:273 (+),score=66.04 GEMP01031842.1:45-863(+)
MREPLVFTCSVLKEPNRLPPLYGPWTARAHIHRKSENSKERFASTGIASRVHSIDQSSRFSSRFHASYDQLDPLQCMGAENITNALDTIRSGFMCTVEDIARSHKTLQRQIAELEATVETLRKEKEAEELHSLRLTDLLARETKKNEEVVYRMNKTMEKNQELASELAELENLYFRSTELASMAQVNSVEPQLSTEAEDKRWLEQESAIHQLRLELSLKDPLVTQLQEQVEQLLLENEMLRARDVTPESVRTDFTSASKDVEAFVKLDVKIR